MAVLVPEHPEPKACSSLAWHPTVTTETKTVPQVVLNTTDQLDAGFDGEVHLRLHGTWGSADEQQLVNNRWGPWLLTLPCAAPCFSSPAHSRLWCLLQPIQTDVHTCAPGSWFTSPAAPAWPRGAPRSLWCAARTWAHCSGPTSGAGLALPATSSSCYHMSMHAEAQLATLPTLANPLLAMKPPLATQAGGLGA